MHPSAAPQLCDDVVLVASEAQSGSGLGGPVRRRTGPRGIVRAEFASGQNQRPLP